MKVKVRCCSNELNYGTVEFRGVELFVVKFCLFLMCDVSVRNSVQIRSLTGSYGMDLA